MGEPSDNSAVSIVDEVAPDGWKKKVAAVLFQMGLGSQKAAKLYGAGRENLDIVEGRSIVNKALAEAVARQAANDPDQVERMKARLLGTAMREQENLEAVLGAAESHMLALPPPVAADEKSARPDEEASISEPLDPDWVDAFTRQAAQANSEDLRDRLSRVLAGEVASPGKYPRAVFRTIVELEKADVEAIRKALPYRLGSQIFLGAAAPNDAALHVTLNSAGLIENSYIGNHYITLNLQPDGLFAKLESRGGFGLYIQTQSQTIEIGQSNILSRTGNVAFDLLDPDPRQTLIAVAQTIQRNGMRIWLIKIESTLGDLLNFRAEQLLFDGLPSTVPRRL